MGKVTHARESIHAQSVWHEQENHEPDSPRPDRIRMIDFIRANTPQIVKEWEMFARTLTPAASNMTPLALRNHIHKILVFIIDDIESPQTDVEQLHKSQGQKKPSIPPSAAEVHASLRLAGGFDIGQMVSEWRALRASVIKLWTEANTQLTNLDMIDLTRFNESIDQALTESVNHYTHKVNYSKDLLLGMLSHDLRTPLGVIMMSDQLLSKIGGLNERQEMLVSQISESAYRATQIVNDLLDVTRARFGAGLPIDRAPMDMGVVSRQLVDEIRIANPTRKIILEVSGDLKGEWDKARIGQLFSNLIGNAIQYSFQDSSIYVTVKGAVEDVLLSLHNEGLPIPSEKLSTIFDALTRAGTDQNERPQEVNLGLGLYITKDIVKSHGGTIDVTSSEEGGTTFTVRLPRAI